MSEERRTTADYVRGFRDGRDAEIERWRLVVEPDGLARLVDALKYAAASTNKPLDETPYGDLASAMLRRLSAHRLIDGFCPTCNGSCLQDFGNLAVGS